MAKKIGLKWSEWWAVGLWLLVAGWTLRSVILGTIPFWFDPARDLLRAWDNLSKPTLLGPSTGIPGVFYGPWWIWLLSLGLIISKDPRLITGLVLTLPYLTIFPWLLIKLFRLKTGLILWVLFMITSAHYATHLWNPHLAPLILLGLIYLLIKVKKEWKKIFLIGLLAGLLMNFHMSLGIGALVASGLFLLIITKWRIIWFGLGVGVAFVPTILFELRHGFHQSRIMIKTVLDSILYNSAVVGQTGLTREEIINKLWGLMSKLLQVPGELATAIYFLLGGLIIFSWTKFDKQKKKLLILMGLLSLIVARIFLSTKNPVWEYHFIGGEIIILLIIGIIINRFKWLQRLLAVWVLILVLKELPNLTSAPEIGLRAKRNIVEKILLDAGEKDFSFKAYSSSIYTYDYDYLFRWLAKGKKLEETRKIYLIIPETEKTIKLDFIEYKTPAKDYQTIEEWNMSDKTSVLVRTIRE